MPGQILARVSLGEPVPPSLRGAMPRRTYPIQKWLKDRSPSPSFKTPTGTEDRLDRILTQLLLLAGYAVKELDGMDLSSKTDYQVEELVELRKVTADAFKADRR